MSEPFRFLQKRTRVSGRIPETTGLCHGELYLQLADNFVLFKNAQNQLTSIPTDRDVSGFNKLKWYGAEYGDFPLWNGQSFEPGSLGDLTDDFYTKPQADEKFVYVNTGSINEGDSICWRSGNWILHNPSQGTSGETLANQGFFSYSFGNCNQTNCQNSFAFGNSGSTLQDGEFTISNGSFGQAGDSQYSLIAARISTEDDQYKFLEINSSTALYPIEYNANIFFTAYVVGAGGSKYAGFEIKGIVKRSSQIEETLQYDSVLFPSNPTVNTFAKTDLAYTAVAIADTTDGSLKIKVKGDETESMRWFAKIDLVKIISS